MKCRRCAEQAEVALPSHNTGFCRECFFLYVGRQVENAIRRHAMFKRDDRILVALSGGKDSLSLMYELRRLGYDATGLHVDLGIAGSSQKARARVEDFCKEHGFPLRVLELAAEGLAIPLVKEHVRRPICSMCGKIKRHFFNRLALEGGFTALATGHNLDDEVARLFANTLRWDGAYLSDQGPCLPDESGFARKVKPFYRLTEFETACYAFLRGIAHHTDACPYSQGASFTGHKRLWADLEHRSPGSKVAFYEGFLERGRPAFAAAAQTQSPVLARCSACGSPTSAETCGVCRVRDLVRRRVAEQEEKKA